MKGLSLVSYGSILTTAAQEEQPKYSTVCVGVCVCDPLLRLLLNMQKVHSCLHVKTREHCSFVLAVHVSIFEKMEQSLKLLLLGEGWRTGTNKPSCNYCIASSRLPCGAQSRCTAERGSSRPPKPLRRMSLNIEQTCPPDEQNDTERECVCVWVCGCSLSLSLDLSSILITNHVWN